MARGTYNNCEGGDLLQRAGRSWFVSYAYYNYCDPKHLNWNQVESIKTRIYSYNEGKKYHRIWLNYIALLNPSKLSTNQIGLSGEAVVAMAKLVLQKMQGRG